MSSNTHYHIRYTRVTNGDGVYHSFAGHTSATDKAIVGKALEQAAYLSEAPTFDKVIVEVRVDDNSWGIWNNWNMHTGRFVRKASFIDGELVQ